MTVNMAEKSELGARSSGRSQVVPRTALLAPHAQDPEAKRAFVQRLFTTIAPRYDRFNRLASLNLDLRWRRRAVALGQIESGMRVLDVCSGTGDFACLCAQRMGGQGLVAGVDFAQAMLRAAVRKSMQAGLAVSWLEGDAQALPVRTGTFDRVVIGFSTRNLSDLRLGILEMLRVLKPQGKLIILETGRPSNPLVRAGYRIFLATIARLIGLIVTGRVWPFTYLAKSVKGFLTPAQFVALINDCGAATTYIPLSGGLASLYIAVKRDTHE